VEEAIELLSGVICLLIYSSCLTVFSHVPHHLRLVEVVYELMECVCKTYMAKGGIDLV